MPYWYFGLQYGKINWLIFYIADIFTFWRVKSQVAYWRYKPINPKRNYCKKEICKASGRKTSRFQASVIDDYTSNPAQKKGKQKTY